MTKYVALGDIFTDDQLKRAAELRHAKAIYREITGPLIDQINERTGQKNDPMYLAYALEWAVSQMEGK